MTEAEELEWKISESKQQIKRLKKRKRQLKRQKKEMKERLRELLGNNAMIKTVMILFLAFFWMSVSTTVILPTEQDKKDFILPEFKDIELGNPVMIRDTAMTLRLGMLAFHAPLGIRHGSCAGCHNVEKAGFSDEPLPNGNMGLFDVLLSKYRDVKLDRPNLKTPPIVNSWSAKNTLWGAELGRQGLNSSVSKKKLLEFKPQNSQNVDGVYIQADVGINAHDIQALLETCKKDTFFVNLTKKAFFTEDVTKQTITTAIAVFEKSVIPNQSRFQKWLKGEVKKLYSHDGFQIFKEKCVSCHSGKAMGNESLGLAIGESMFEGRRRMTKDDSDFRMVKVPQLYNLKDSPSFFHNSEKMSLYKAIKKHDLGLSRSETHKVKKFVQKDLYDPNMKRFLEY